jgi:hypothetical protein
MKYVFDPKVLQEKVMSFDNSQQFLMYMIGCCSTMIACGDVEWAKKYTEKDKVAKGDYTPLFEEFWKKYPKKIGKGGAFKSWKSGKLDRFSAEINVALEWQKKQPNWLQDNGKYIPNPETYLNNRRWDDEPPLSITGSVVHGERYQDMNGVWRVR